MSERDDLIEQAHHAPPLPNIAGRYRAGHPIDCVVCGGATAQHPDHEYEASR